MDKLAGGLSRTIKLKPAIEQARLAIAGVNAPGAAAKAGCEYADGVIRLRLFDKSYLVTPLDGMVKEDPGGLEPAWEIQLILLHYLINADGVPPAGMWITFRHVPDGMVFESRFNAMAVDPLLRRFRLDMGGFDRACESLGGARMSRTGDSSYRFMALPQIPMGVILYLQDEEVSGSASILFDAVAPNYLCAEDLAGLGVHLCQRLLRAS